MARKPAAATPRPHTEERGELALRLEGQDLILRPTYEAIVAFEASTGKGLLQLARDGLSGSLSLGEVAQIAAECIRAWGRATNTVSAQGVKAERVAELVLESEGGFRAAITTVSSMLALATTGGYTAKGEVKPATMTNGAPVAG